MSNRSPRRSQYVRKQPKEGTPRSSTSQVLLSLGEGLVAATVFAVVIAPMLLVLGVTVYAHMVRHTGVEVEWNLLGGFADPVGLLATVAVFSITAIVRYRRRLSLLNLRKSKK